MRLLIFLVFSQSRLASKYGIIFPVQHIIRHRIEFPNTLYKNC